MSACRCAAVAAGRVRLEHAAARAVAARVAATSLRLDQITTRVAAGGVIALLSGFLVFSSRKPTPCEMCRGMGAWDCVVCAGDGRLVDGRKRRECPACVGRGKRLCKKCDGSGWNKRTNYIG